MYNLSAGDHYFWFLILKYQFGLQKEPKADVSYAICNYYQYCLKPTVHGKKHLIRLSTIRIQSLLY